MSRIQALCLMASSACLAGCNAGPFEAPLDAVLSFTPDAYEIVPSDQIRYSGLDTDAEGNPYETTPRGYMLAASALVADESPPDAYADSTYALSNISVEIRSLHDGVYVLPATAVEIADLPSPPEGVTSQEDVEAECDTDGNGRIDDDAEDWCSYWWDAENQRYYQVKDTYHSSGDDFFRPNLYIGATSSRGILEFYIFVDELAWEQDSSGNEKWWGGMISGSITNSVAEIIIDVADSN